MLLPTYAPMKPSPFRSPAGGIWSDLYMIAEPGAVSQARRFTEAYLRRRRLTPLTDTATLVTSELVTNAVRATGTPPNPSPHPDDPDPAVVGLRLRLSPASLFVEVWDRDPRPPVLTRAGAYDEGGRGPRPGRRLRQGMGPLLLDHTRPYDKGGRACKCNTAPLCQTHHRVFKQHRQWKLVQLWPGLLIWVAPAGSWHIALPR